MSVNREEATETRVNARRSKGSDNICQKETIADRNARLTMRSRVTLIVGEESCKFSDEYRARVEKARHCEMQEKI